MDGRPDIGPERIGTALGARFDAATLDPVPWMTLGQLAHLAAAFAALLIVVPLARREGTRGAGIALFAAAAWSLAVAISGPASAIALYLESARNLAWLLLLHRLFARDGRHERLRPLRPLLLALATVEGLQPLLVASEVALAGESAAVGVTNVSGLLHMMVSAGALVLVHNLYVGVRESQRSALRWSCAAMALYWAADLNVYTIAWLGGEAPASSVALRGATALAVAALIAIGFVREDAEVRLSPSRSVAFQSLSLGLIGLYMLVMAGIARSLTWLGFGSLGAIEMVFLVATVAGCLAILPSRRLRGWLRVVVAKHLFQHRYDYRAEWLRFTETIGRPGLDALPLEQRVVKALADITESSSGLLFTPDEAGALALAARWQWRTLEVPAPAMAIAAVDFFERTGFIADLDAVRRGTGHGEEEAYIPAWLLTERDAWAIVPLVHFGKLAGLVVLSRPPLARRLDWEDFDLLRVAGGQLGSYLAENAGHRALLESSRFDEFNRRIAFVMHDVKNLASQLALLARNAERHADNPAFRADMLVTLRNAADKLNALIARLSRYSAGPIERLEPVDLGVLGQLVAARHAAAGRRVIATGGGSNAAPILVTAEREKLDQVLDHLVQNALDASNPDLPVLIQVGAVDGEGTLDVVDCGSGMSAEFVRTGLFAPFVSTKPGGFGIGAFEARELVRAMHGRLEVESREGLGSRFVIRLPLHDRAAAFAIETEPTDHPAAMAVLPARIPTP